VDSTETALAAISASLAVLALALAALVVRGRRLRSEQRFQTVLGHLDHHLTTISQSLERVVERSAAAQARGVDELELTIEFDELLRRIATEAAARTGAEAAAIHVQGPGGVPRSAAFGASARAQPLEAPLAQAAGPFRAVTINWSYRPGDDQDLDPFSSALVVPIAENGVETGTLAAYSPAEGVFGREHVQALEALAEEASAAIASARRFAEAQRGLTDTVTGLKNTKGYEVELERAVTRAQDTGQPLSLLILNRSDPDAQDEPARDPRTDLALQELAGLLLRLTRATDVVCLRREAQFGIVLPNTPGDPAQRFYGRLREEAARTSFPVTRQLTFAAGLVEWRPNETSDALDARAFEALGHARAEPLELLATPAAPGSESGAAGLRASFEARLGQEIERARQLESSLALLVLEVEGIRRIDRQHGPRAAERVLMEVEARLGPSLENGDVSARVGKEALAVILGGSATVKAELVFGALQTSLDADPATHLDRLGVTAGVTEVTATDDASSALVRAEHALWRARRAGHGTIVVAMAADEPRH
jgi:diguanylate cyclase (GGDEF)-like protein